MIAFQATKVGQEKFIMMGEPTETRLAVKIQAHYRDRKGRKGFGGIHNREAYTIREGGFAENQFIPRNYSPR
jgi:hypothetical protein